MTNLGELLKSEREKRSLSLHEIGMSLKINPKILKAIEEGDQANLPAKTFLRGFVKSYAQYLRIDVNEALRMFQEEYGGPKAESIVTQPSAPQAPQPSQGVPKYEGSLKRPDDAALPVANNNRIYTILFAILLLTLIAFVAKMMDKYQKEARDAKYEMAETLDSTTTTTAPMSTAGSLPPAAVTPVDGSTVTTTTLAGAGAETTATTLAGVSTTTTLKSNATVPVTATAGTTNTTLRPALATTTTTTLRPAVAAAAPATTTLRPGVSTTTTSTTSTTLNAASTTTTVKPAMTEVIVEALNRVSIRFSLNGGQKWETLELNPDQVHTFRSRTSVQLEVTDGGAVNVIVNGRDRGVPGTIGRPLKLNFP